MKTIVSRNIQVQNIVFRLRVSAAKCYGFMKIEDNRSLAASYLNIGVVYKEMKEYDLALEYYDKSLLLKKEILGENN